MQSMVNPLLVVAMFIAVQ